MVQLFTVFGACFVAVQILMLLCWCLYLFKRNVALIDIAWGTGFILSVWAILLLGDGYFWRKMLIATVVSIWGLRLTAYLTSRFRFDREDPRYRLIFERWPLGAHPTVQVLLMYILQGSLITFLAIPFILAGEDGTPFFRTNEVFGLLIWMVGVAGESIADRQLALFKRDPANKDEILDKGLWKYSRHPNYFFEWIVWIGYFVMTVASPYGWIGFLSPALMLYLLREVSGIPITEVHLLMTKGEKYRDYQLKTGAFFPRIDRLFD